MSGTSTALQKTAAPAKSRLFHRLAISLVHWFEHSARDLPWRRTSDPYAIWVSEVMLQQTQVKTVIPYWERWMRAMPDVQSLAKASSHTLHKLWEGLGYYIRVRNMQKAARQLLYAHRGVLPRTVDELLNLPGIGRYTAGAICSIAYNQPSPVLDGNVIRVLTRLFGIAGNPREKGTNEALWQLAESLVCAAEKAPSARPCSALNQALMELGAVLCKPREPGCLQCPVRQQCVAYRAHRVLDFPNLPKRPPAISRHFRAFVLQCDGKYLVRQRPPGVVNAGLWEFPVLEEVRTRPVRLAAKAALGVTPSGLRRFLTLVHSITRYRIRLEVFFGRMPKARSVTRGRWLTLSGLERLPFPGAHKKILTALRHSSPPVSATPSLRVSPQKPNPSRHTPRN